MSLEIQGRSQPSRSKELIDCAHLGFSVSGFCCYLSFNFCVASYCHGMLSLIASTHLKGESLIGLNPEIMLKIDGQRRTSTKGATGILDVSSLPV